jgi:site-specific DNA-methyltransferase (adenine-specific)
MTAQPITENTLFYGDNLDILREYILSESVDLIYLDPPFNSSRNYNVLFKNESGQESEAQITAFEDTWHWNESAERTYRELTTVAPDRVVQMIAALRQFVGTNQMMAYLVMMAARLVELHRVLKPTGSLYLHCDPTASHYLKIILDTVFGAENFRNEIIWKRRTGSSSAVHQSNKFGVCTDSIFFYAKTHRAGLHPQYNMEAEGYQEYVDKFFRFVDENGRRYRLADLSNPAPRPNLMYEYKGYKPPRNGWAISKEKMALWETEGRLYFPKNPEGRIQRKRFLDELKGKPIQSLWDDVEPIGAHAAERLNYPTQKPLALVERIIQASSNPGDMVLDPFAGCGTTVAAAQKLGRRWVGIDITHLSIALLKYRLEGMYPGIKFNVVGEPEDLEGAQDLAGRDRYQFQWWALSLVRAKPLGGQEGSKIGKKGSDKGMDGVINFIDDNSGKPKRVLIQVKSGKVQPGLIRDLGGTLGPNNGEIGVFITLEEPTKDMITEALKNGFYHSPGWNRDYPKIQILTIADLLKGAEIKMPPAYGTFKEAQKVKIDVEQTAFDVE